MAAKVKVGWYWYGTNPPSSPFDELGEARSKKEVLKLVEKALDSSWPNDGKELVIARPESIE